MIDRTQSWKKRFEHISRRVEPGVIWCDVRTEGEEAFDQNVFQLIQVYIDCIHISKSIQTQFI